MIFSPGGRALALLTFMYRQIHNATNPHDYNPVRYYIVSNPTTPGLVVSKLIHSRWLQS